MAKAKKDPLLEIKSWSEKNAGRGLDLLPLDQAIARVDDATRELVALADRALQAGAKRKAALKALKEAFQAAKASKKAARKLST